MEVINRVISEKSWPQDKVLNGLMYEMIRETEK